MMSLFMVSYSLWSLYCFFQSGLWPYRKFDLSIFISRVGGWLILSIGFMVPSWPGDPYCLSFDKSWKSVINKVGVVPSVVIFVPFCLLLSLIGTMTVKKIQTLPIFSHTLNNNIRLTVSASNKKSSWGYPGRGQRTGFQCPGPWLRRCPEAWPFLAHAPIILKSSVNTSNFIRYIYGFCAYSNCLLCIIVSVCRSCWVVSRLDLLQFAFFFIRTVFGMGTIGLREWRHVINMVEILARISNFDWTVDWSNQSSFEI